MGAHPTVKDIGRLHPDLASLLRTLHDFISSNDKILGEIRSSFNEVTDIATEARRNFKWKSGDAQLINEDIDEAEEVLEYIQPSVERLARLTECLQNDFERLDSGLVAVPPIEHAELIEDFLEKIDLLEKTVDSVKRSMESIEERESDETKLVNFRKTLTYQQELISQLNRFLNSAEAKLR